MEKIENTNLEFVRELKDGEVILKNNDTGEFEMWTPTADDDTDFAVEINGIAYEYTGQMKESEQKMDVKLLKDYEDDDAITDDLEKLLRNKVSSIISINSNKNEINIELDYTEKFEGDDVPVNFLSAEILINPSNQPKEKDVIKFGVYVAGGVDTEDTREISGPTYEDTIDSYDINKITLEKVADDIAKILNKIVQKNVEENKKMKESKQKPYFGAGLPKVEVYKQDKTQDYIVIIDNGISASVYEMSDNALAPNGVNMYSGELDELPDAKKGKKIEVKDLPADVQTAIKQRIESYEKDDEEADVEESINMKDYLKKRIMEKMNEATIDSEILPTNMLCVIKCKNKEELYNVFSKLKNSYMITRATPDDVEMQVIVNIKATSKDEAKKLLKQILGNILENTQIENMEIKKETEIIPETDVEESTNMKDYLKKRIMEKMNEDSSIKLYDGFDDDMKKFKDEIDNYENKYRKYNKKTKLYPISWILKDKEKFNKLYDLLQKHKWLSAQKLAKEKLSGNEVNMLDTDTMPERLCRFIEDNYNEAEIIPEVEQPLDEADFQRRHYVSVAEILRNNVKDEELLNKLTNAFIEYFENDNPQFDEDRFKDAIFGEKEEIKNV